MNTVGFVTGLVEDTDTYRGMDAYAKYLWDHLKKIQNQTDLKIVEITSRSQLNAQLCDLYHFPVFSLYFPTIPLSLARPYVVTVHDVTRLEFPVKYPPGIKGRIKLEQQKLILHKSKFIITDSYSSVNQLRKYLKIPHAKIKLVYLAASEIFRPVKNPADLKIIRDKYDLPKTFVLFNGDIDWNKNLSSLAQACESLNLSLVVYGKSAKDFWDHPEKYNMHHSELSHLPKLRKLLAGKNIRLLGFVPDEDLVKIFNLAAVYCQPSFAEGFGIPVLQALACKTPVACSRTHSLPEVAGDAAVYFDPYNIDSLITAVKRVITDQKLRSSLRSAGLVQAGKFGWTKTADETIQVYKQALSP